VKKLSSDTRKSISLLLAFIITAWTITAFFPFSSFSLKQVQAIPDNQKDDIDCNNININVNGLNFTELPEPLSNLLESQEQTGASDIGSNTFGIDENRSDSYGKGFAFVCINKNTNEFNVSHPLPPVPPTPPTEDFLDLAVTNFLSDDVFILLGDGDGTFTQAAESPITLGDSPQSVAVGDFDGDDVLDLAVTNEDSDDVSILLGDGDGTFTQAAESPITVGDEPQSVAVGDFDGDDVLDLAVTNGGTDNVSILLGDGDGTFTQAAESPITLGDFPFSVAVGDFDGDDVLDLAVTNEDSNDVFILLGDGDGTFTQAAESPITVGDFPFSAAVGDFDGDDVLDLAVTNVDSDDVSILLGDGDGTFTQAAESPITAVGVGPWSVAVGNFN
jgi:hypothetical protein